MPKDYSPFTPGQPVPVEFFVGRRKEIENLRQGVSQSLSGRLHTAFLTGERGIGKSSLASFFRYLAEKENQVLGLHTFLGGVSSLEEMARRIFDRLLKESMGKTWGNKLKTFFGNHIKKVGGFGITVEFDPPHGDLRRIVNNFAPSLRNLSAKLKKENAAKAILLILDDINGLASSREFADWLKSLVDEIATSGKSIPLFLLLVGLEERRRSMVNLQPSVARIFHVIQIDTWSEEETKDFFHKAFAGVNVVVDEDAMEILCRFTGGLPVLAHEIGDAVFNLDKDGKIDKKDATEGVIAAADIVGRKHLEPNVFQSIRSARYREILRKIAKKPLFQFERSEIFPHLNQDEKKALDNFLRKMKELGVIRPDPDAGRGHYRFTNRLHYLYFRLEAERARKTR